MRSNVAVLLRVVAGLLLTSGCADFERGPASSPIPPSTDTDGEGGDTDGLSFAADVHGVLVDDCASCHASGADAGRTDFILTSSADSDYAQVLLFIDETSPQSSRLLTKASGVGHSAGAVWPSDSSTYATLIEWIETGALP